MKEKEITQKVCPIFASTLLHVSRWPNWPPLEAHCLGSKCTWISVTKKSELLSEPDPGFGGAHMIFSEAELPKEDWEYECGLVSKLAGYQGV